MWKVNGGLQWKMYFIPIESACYHDVCDDRQLEAEVYSQLQGIPMLPALKSVIDQGLLGKVVHFDAWLVPDTARIRCSVSINHDHLFM